MSGEKVFVVEDEKNIVKVLKYNLETEGYRVLCYRDGKSALDGFRKERPDLVILDLMLPEMDGFEFCKIVRRELTVPILILTARKEEMDKVLGFELGADDYVTKPFGVRELLARVKAMLRRVAEKKVSIPRVRAGELDVDLERYEVRVSGRPVTLRPKEFEFLRCLIRANGKVLTRKQILEKIWGYDKSIEIDTNTVDQHIARMRERLGPEAARIVTVKKVGYRFKMD